MQISKKRLKKEVEKEAYQIFYQLFADLSNPKEVKIFLNDFLTKIEATSLVKRLMVALNLEEGKSYDYIKENLRVSSATIANVDKMMNKNSGGFVLAFRKIKAEQWAENLTKKISEFFEKFC